MTSTTSITDNLTLAGKVSIVTGGASGIGRATALLLAKHGARVFIGDYKIAPNIAAEFQQAGIHLQPCDVRKSDDVARLVNTAISTAGGVDILINNAGIVMVGQIPDLTEADWDACLDTNLKAAYLFARRVIPSMQHRGGGVIVNISSNAGLLPRAHDPIYSTSKGALNAFTRSLALSHAPDRIRVNAICPGPVAETGIMDADLAKSTDPTATAHRMIAASPLAKAFNRMITPHEVAQAVLYLVSDAATMVTGTCLALDGGKSLGVPAT